MQQQKQKQEWSCLANSRRRNARQAAATGLPWQRERQQLSRVLLALWHLLLLLLLWSSLPHLQAVLLM